MPIWKEQWSEGKGTCVGRGGWEGNVYGGLSFTYKALNCLKGKYVHILQVQ